MIAVAAYAPVAFVICYDSKSLTVSDDDIEKSDFSSMDSDFFSCCYLIANDYQFIGLSRAVFVGGAVRCSDEAGDRPDETRERPDGGFDLAFSYGVVRGGGLVGHEIAGTAMRVAARSVVTPKGAARPVAVADESAGALDETNGALDGAVRPAVFYVRGALIPDGTGKTCNGSGWLPEGITAAVDGSLSRLDCSVIVESCNVDDIDSAASTMFPDEIDSS